MSPNSRLQRTLLRCRFAEALAKEKRYGEQARSAPLAAEPPAVRPQKRREAWLI